MADPSSDPKRCTSPNQTKLSGNRRSGDQTSSQENNDGEISQPLDTGFQLVKSSQCLISPTEVWCDRCYNIPGRAPFDDALACNLCGTILENFDLSAEVTFVKNAAGQENASQRITPTMVWCRHCSYVPRRGPYDGALACNMCGMILENITLSTEVTLVKNPAGQMKISSTRITTPKNCSRSEAYQLLSESDRTSSKENNDDEISQPLDTGFQLVDTSQSTMTLKNCSRSDEAYQLLSEHRTSSQQNKDGEISQPLDVGLQLENSSRWKITPTNCSRSEACQLLSESCAAAVKQYNDPTADLSERAVMDYGGNVKGNLPHQVVPTSNSGGLAGLSAAKTSIEDLPYDLLTKIFDRAAMKSTKNERSLVCRTWHSLDRYRQKSLTIREMPKPFLPLQARGYASLISVVIDHRLADSPQLHQSTSRAGGEVVYLVRDEDLTQLADEFPRLQHLELLGCDLVTEAGLTYLVQHCRSLAYLHLQSCCRFDDDAVLAVVRACVSLQHFRVTFCEVTSACIHTLGTFTTVSAEGCPLSEALRAFPSPV